MWPAWARILLGGLCLRAIVPEVRLVPLPELEADFGQLRHS